MVISHGDMSRFPLRYESAVHFMKIFLMPLAVLVVSLSAFAATSTDDSQAVQGTWTPTKAELGGKAMPDTILKTISLKLDDGKYEVLVGNSPDRGTYTLDATTKPRSMSVTG